MSGALDELAVVLVGHRVLAHVVSRQVRGVRRPLAARAVLLAASHGEGAGRDQDHEALIGLGQDVAASLLQVVPAQLELFQAGLHLGGLFLGVGVAALHLLAAHFLVVNLLHQLLRRPVEFQQQDHEVETEAAGENPPPPFAHGRTSWS
jgi:hypothetical protein